MNIDPRFLSLLEPLHPGEVYILFGAARKKYCEAAKTTRGVEFGTFDEVTLERLTSTLEKVEYNTRRLGFPDEAYVYYMDLNPKSLIKAFRDVMKYGLDAIAANQLSTLRTVGREWYSCVHRNNARTIYSLIDVDKKDASLLDEISHLLSGHILYTTETRGGYHIIVKKSKTSGKIIYEQIRAKYPAVDLGLFEKGNPKNKHLLIEVEPKRQVQTPIPGTIQGGFEVKIHSIGG
jgi:hypothetical protein